MAKSESESDTKSTLYCSFCGKSQHEVNKLIAGPTTFICDECVELCDDIIWEEHHGKVSIKIKLPTSSAFDEMLYNSIASIVSERYPGYEFNFEYKLPSKHRPNKGENIYAVFSASKESGEGVFPIKAQMQDMALKMGVMTKKFLHESQKVREINNELTALKSEYLEFLRSNVGAMRKPELNLRVVLFLDIAGFSKFSYENKQEVVDMLRGITPALIASEDPSEINMWGDAIVANFADPNFAVAAAVKFMRHLSVERLDARIGMAWGEIRTSYNASTGRRDIDGPVVDFAARIEPMAEHGQILVSQEFGGLDIDPSIAKLQPVIKTIKKDFAHFREGDNIDLFEVVPLRN